MKSNLARAKVWSLLGQSGWVYVVDSGYMSEEINPELTLHFAFLE